MNASTCSTLFVVWCTLQNGDRKPRVVVDFRGLNRISLRDSYPLPRQEDIISFTQGATHISVFDALAFFYQWAAHPDDWHKLAVNLHRGQEFFTVAPMGYCNSPPHAQRQADRIIRAIADFVRVYVDDFVLRSMSAKDHLRHLDQFLTTLQKANVTISPAKTFIRFPGVRILGNFVDGLGLASLEERVQAIRNIKEPHSLVDLERFLGITGYLRDKIPRYAEIAEPLQQRKTELLQGAPNADPKRDLYVDLDASARAFGVMVYHLKLTSPAESRYYSSEQEVACLVWAVRKIRHLIENAEASVIIYTDHTSTSGIANHTHLGSSATDKLNKRLIRAS
ncbi:uncharacterized protein N7496_003542 [Penicillium cataractarum]|uniref:Reverse transcriptase domain-containing protein n=1 Tax=Penicillium cataractarum TaxID=2100454 RepID=A0A9W9VHM9_9EURO|nr:uncharacterized protein N7496_003542 [Penicillium cataractarum]KAJ5381114.1 hypothetical protein N7496_003542 [Penicillium cataractarum]